MRNSPPIYMLLGRAVIMKIKNLLKSLLVAYGLTGVFLLILSFLVFRLDLGAAPVAAGIVAVYVVSCLTGGFMAGRLMRRDKYLWGLFVGLAYFLLLVFASSMAQRRWDMSFSHLITTFCMCLGGGALGGMLA